MAKKITTKKGNIYQTLIEPWITEAATMLTGENKYVFKVEKSSTKKEIKKAVEEFYKVEVVSVRTVNIPSKKRMRGRIEGKKAGFKKAIVKVKEGQSINIYEEK